MPDIRVDAFASHPHYFDHIQPVWEALDPLGEFYVTPSAKRPGPRIRGLPASDTPLIVAGYPDLKRTRRPVIFIEHGAGETYGMADSHYAGGRNRDRVVLFLCPNRRVFEANEAKYPARSVIVGSPRLEWLAQHRDRNARESSSGSTSGRLRVAVSFHWNCQIHPQAGTALFEFADQFNSWTRAGVEVKGHAHPRIADRARKLFYSAGLEFIEDFADVVAWADVYAVDNSSTLFEAAALGLDVVVLDASRYTAQETGWRFWKYADIGPRIGAGQDLVEAAIRSVSERARYSEIRHRMATEIFGPVEGATSNAVNAIERLHDDLGTKSIPPGSDSGTHSNQPSLFGSG